MFPSEREQTLPRDRRISESERTAAVKRVLDYGQTQAHVAREFRVHRSTIGQWVREERLRRQAQAQNDTSRLDRLLKPLPILGALGTVATIALGVLNFLGDQDQPAREIASKVHIESGVHHLKLPASYPEGVPPDVVVNNGGETISDVWVEAVGPEGGSQLIDMGTVLPCAAEGVGGPGSDDQRLYVAKVVHFVAAGTGWKKTATQKLSRDHSDKPTAAQGLEAGGDHGHQQLDDCG